MHPSGPRGHLGGGSGLGTSSRRERWAACPALLSSGSATSGRSLLLSGPISSARKRRDWLKSSRAPYPNPQGLKFWDPENRAAPQGLPALRSPGKGRGGEVSRVSAVFLQDRSFGESLASTFFSLLMKLIMNTAWGHLTPEIHVKIKYF